MTFSELQLRRAAVADKLHELAVYARADRSRGDTTGAQLLDSLSGALRANAGASLAGVDLRSAYPPEVLLPDRRSPILERVLPIVRLLRDVLIFVPVGYTWWKLQGALDAYGAVAKTPTDPGPFLSGWQRGTFGNDAAGHATSFESLSSTAGVVAALVLVVLISTGLVNFIEWWVDERCSNAARRQEIGELLALTGVLVQPSAEGLTGSLGQMTQFAQRLEASTDRMVRALAEVSSEIQAAVEGGPADRIAAAMDAWVLKAERLEALLTGIKVPAETLEAFQRIQQAIAEDQRVLRTELEGIVRRMQAAIGEMAGHTDAAWALKEELASKFDASGSKIADSIHQLTDLTQKVGTFVDVAQRIVEYPPTGNGQGSPR